MQRIEVTSTLDGSRELSWFLPPSAAGAPLVVYLHTWSSTADQARVQAASFLPRLQQDGWALLIPEFRGASLHSNPRVREACGSRLARQDILDAVDYVVAEHALDENRLFVMGGSGGGFMGLLMAAMTPEKWRGVSVYCPITDLAAWFRQSPRYGRHVQAGCGGPPGAAAEIDAEYADRSPLTHAARIARATVYINHGRDDRSVPVSHSLELYRRILEAHPEARAWLHIYPGGHSGNPAASLEWFRRLLAEGAPTADAHVPLSE